MQRYSHGSRDVRGRNARPSVAAAARDDASDGARATPFCAVLHRLAVIQNFVLHLSLLRPAMMRLTAPNRHRFQATVLLHGGHADVALRRCGRPLFWRNNKAAVHDQLQLPQQHSELHVLRCDAHHVVRNSVGCLLGWDATIARSIHSSFLSIWFGFGIEYRTLKLVSLTKQRFLLALVVFQARDAASS